MNPLPFLAAVLALVAGLPVTAAAGANDCVRIVDDASRLACYDRAAGRAATAPSPSPATAPAPTPAAQAEPAATPLAIAVEPPSAGDSALSQLWELDPADKHGTFKLLPYKQNYLLPARFTTSANTLPNSPGVENGLTTPLAVQATEAKFQLSVKLKAWENIFGDNGDLWFGYTQQSSWQLYNNDESRPFRESDYAPEAMLAFRTDYDIFGWRWRLLNLGFVHQSNGRAVPLSRSWNRVYAQFGFERGDFTVLAQPWYRLKENAASDDNPDIGDYMGFGDLRVVYANKGHVYSALGRYSFSDNRGGLELEWAFPLIGPLKGYLQFTTGYGESLIDYNHSQSTIGLGVLLLPW